MTLVSWHKRDVCFVDFATFCTSIIISYIVIQKETSTFIFLRDFYVFFFQIFVFSYAFEEAEKVLVVSRYNLTTVLPNENGNTFFTMSKVKTSVSTK